MVEFAIQLSDARMEIGEAVQGMDHEHSEAYVVSLLSMLVMKR
jgi:hypothetical protein